MTKFELDQVAIRRLATLLNKENLAEIEVGDGDAFVRITRTVAGQVLPAQSGMQMAPVPTPASAPASPAPPSATPPPKTDTIDSKDAVKSPIVGTAYLAPSPDADAFISVGSTVKKGDTLLIVEAMKVMNPIVAPRDGKVTGILVENADPVEFDQPLVVLS